LALRSSDSGCLPWIRLQRDVVRCPRPGDRGAAGVASANAAGCDATLSVHRRIVRALSDLRERRLVGHSMIERTSFASARWRCSLMVTFRHYWYPLLRLLFVSEEKSIMSERARNLINGGVASIELEWSKPKSRERKDSESSIRMSKLSSRSHSLNRLAPERGEAVLRGYNDHFRSAHGSGTCPHKT